MYPETDLPLLHISRDFINETKKSLPKLRSDIKGELKEKGLSEEMILLILGSGKLDEIEALLKVYNQPNFVAKLLLVFPKEVASHIKINEDIFTIDVLESVLGAIRDKKIQESDSKHVLEEFAKGKSILDALKIQKADAGELETEIAKIIRDKPGLNANAYMGLVMAKFKGKVSGKEVMNILQKLVK
jgi:Glu-tRNA(Gln) amidotransferase subunit E-like FAD-binding protein